MKEANDGTFFCKTPVNVKYNGSFPSRVALVYIETTSQSVVYLDIKCPLKENLTEKVSNLEVQNIVVTKYVSCLYNLIFICK